MRVAFVIGTMSGGGAERVISVLANWFSKQDYKVSVITIIDDNISYELNRNIKYYPNKKKNRGKINRIVNRYIFTRNRLKDIKPDIIVSFTTEVNIYVLLASIGLNIKTIISERNDPIKDPPSKITRLIRKLVYRFSDRFIFQTDDARNYFSKKIQRNSNIIPNPLKPNLPDPFNGKRKNEFVTVARLSKQKNLKMLIDAFSLFSKNNSDFILKIYGEGPLRDELIEYINQKGLNQRIFLMGFEKDIHKKIIASKCFILTSNYEGISNSMIESLAIGLPTICTDCPAGGARMFIKNNVNGILVPVGDVQYLYKEMERVVNESGLLDILSTNSVRIRDELSEYKICAKWEEEIKRTMKL